MADESLPKDTFRISRKKQSEDDVFRIKKKETGEGDIFRITRGEEDIYDRDFTLTVASHQVNVTDGLDIYGKPLWINLPEGDYKIRAVSGACNDDDTGDLWTWHVRTSATDIVTHYSLIASSEGYGWASSAAQALDSVKDLVIGFYWKGGPFMMFLPTNDIVEPTNNTGACMVNIRSAV
jgi:hypothetical protein